MKLIEAFGKGSGKWVNAYEKKDIDAMRPTWLKHMKSGLLNGQHKVKEMRVHAL